MGKMGAWLARTVRSVLPQLEEIGAATAAEVDIDTLEDRLRDAVSAVHSQVLSNGAKTRWRAARDAVQGSMIVVGGPRKSRNARNCGPETGAPQPNLRECRRFSPPGNNTPETGLAG
jgi:hypothetical protein